MSLGLWILISMTSVIQVYSACDNCATCQPNDDASTTCLVCNAGYYRKHDGCTPCEHTCAANASSSLPKCREADAYCEFGCNDGFYGNECKSPCSDSCSNNTCDRPSGRCSYGCTDTTICGDFCLGRCPEGCLDGRGTQDHDCLECKPNYYNHPKCDQRCDDCSSNLNDTGDRLCDVNNGTCFYGCNGGNYWGPFCNISCPEGCDEDQCDFVSGNCTGSCRNNTFWGSTCSESCGNNCLNGICSKENGTCLSGCSTNSTWSQDCSRNCSERCSNSECSRETGDCIGPCQGMIYWGSNCSNECSTNCNSSQCDKTNGICGNGCTNSSVWGETCSHACSANCLENKCQQSDGACIIGCMNSTWGENCTLECSTKCQSKTCNWSNGTCTYGCMISTWGETCTNACSANCLNDECLQYNGSCTHGCVKSTWGDICNTTCPANCNDSVCTQPDGICNIGCVISTWGYTCDKSCPENCNNSTCTQSDGLCDQGCVNSTWGQTCKDTCPLNCANNKCKQVDGSCFEGCTNSTWGNTCNETCSSSCINHACLQSDGMCTGCTNETSWGKFCSNACPAQCKDGQCGRSDGQCTAGCINKKYWGERCNRKCAKYCLNGICSQNNGTCISGCVNNTLWGPTCNETCSNCETGCKRATGKCTVFVTDSDSIWLYVGIACGLAAFIAILVAVIVVTRRRFHRKERFDEDNEALEMEVEQRSDSHGNRLSRHLNALSTLFVQNPVMKMLQRGLTQKFQPRQSDGVKTNKIEVDQLLPTVICMERSELEVEFESLDDGFAKPYGDAVKNDNIAKSTYTNIYPYDENRVVLERDNIGGGDFINASFIDGFKTKKRYIAAQGPSMYTKADFWRMVWEYKVYCITMLNGTPDNDPSAADNYVPELGTDDVFGDVAIYSRSRENYADFTINIFKLARGGEARTVLHVTFLGWPGSVPPSSPSALVEFHQKFRSLVQETQAPIIVHCSAGVGRTGVFVALDYLVDEGLSTGSVDVYNCISELRKQRVQMVQTQEQYEFLYRTVAQTLGVQCQLIPLVDFASHSTDLEEQFEHCEASLELDREEIPAMTSDQEMRNKDRPTSDIPSPRYRPTLASNTYINAVHHDTYRQKEGIFVTQMPTPDTVVDFCRLVKEKNCCTILMLNNADQKKKSHGIYWPKKGSVLKYGGIHVSTVAIEETPSIVQRTLKFETKKGKVKETQEVRMLQYREWSDLNQLPNVRQLTELVCTVRQHMNRYPGRPLLVHCLNGSQQSGLYCVIHDLMEKLLTEDEISVINSVRKLKVRLPKALPSLEQFRLCYEAVSSHIAHAEIKADAPV